jgi:hypothetical protein
MSLFTRKEPDSDELPSGAETGEKSPSGTPIGLAKSRWRVSCETRTDWMREEARIAAVRRNCTVDPVTGKWVSGADELRIAYEGVVSNTERSRRAARSTGRQFWRYPGYADIAISRMQAADVFLVRLLTDEMLWGELPRIKDIVRNYLATDDQRRTWLEGFAASSKDDKSFKPADRNRIESALRGAYVANGFTRGRLRTFNNVLLVAAAVLMALTVLLGVMNAHWTSNLACGKLSGGGLVCPLGNSPNSSDILLIELIGAAGATVAAVYSLARTQRVEDPYMVHVAQAILKVSLGGITAVLGLLLLFATPGFHLDTAWQILAYAAIFGYSQQVFTRLIDSKGEELQKAASPTSPAASPATRATSSIG